MQVGVRIPDGQIHGFCRRRCGIESSYRLLNQIRPRTTSRQPAVRFLFTAIGLILTNIWVSIYFHHCRTSHAAVDRVDLGRFRLRRFRDFLCHAVARIHGAVLSIPILGTS